MSPVSAAPAHDSTSHNDGTGKSTIAEGTGSSTIQTTGKQPATDSALGGEHQDGSEDDQDLSGEGAGKTPEPAADDDEDFSDEGVDDGDKFVSQCYESEDCHYAMRARQIEESETLRKKIHWCKQYTKLLAGPPVTKIVSSTTQGTKKMVWKKEHTAWIERFCAHYAWYGESGGVEGLTNPDMAVRLLREVGGCQQKYSFCHEMKIRLAKKLENYGQVSKAAGLLTHVKDIFGTPVPRRGRMLSKEGQRDKELREVLAKYTSVDDIRTVLVILHGKVSETIPQALVEIPGLNLENFAIPPTFPSYSKLCQNECYPIKDDDPIPLSLANQSESPSDTEEETYLQLCRDFTANQKRETTSPTASRPRKKTRWDDGYFPKNDS